jgi:HEAT repeat protein
VVVVRSTRPRRSEADAILLALSYESMVEDLALPHRARTAEKALIAAGMAATPAVRRGLGHDDPRVRMHCCRVLDHFLDEAALPELVENLSSPHDEVRTWALHALACDRCKEGACRPGEAETLPLALRMLREDPSPQVRLQALALLAAAVHRDDRVVPAIQHAFDHDPDRQVRKSASWWLPGGPRYERTKPRGRGRLPAS